MEIQEFKQRWNGQPIELISNEEACVLVNLPRELEERASYVTQKAETIGWQASKVVSVANGWAEHTRNLIFVGDDVVGKPVTTTTKVRSFGEFRRDFENMMSTLQTRVEVSDYVMGAIRSLGFDVRPDTTVEKMTATEIAAVASSRETGVVPAFANTSAAVYISLDERDRNVRFVAVAGAGWYKVTFAER
mgnify:FL=1|jgi:hypothetical protein